MNSWILFTPRPEFRVECWELGEKGERALRKYFSWRTWEKRGWRSSVQAITQESHSWSPVNPVSCPFPFRTLLTCSQGIQDILCLSVGRQHSKEASQSGTPAHLPLLSPEHELQGHHSHSCFLHPGKLSLQVQGQEQKAPWPSWDCVPPLTGDITSPWQTLSPSSGQTGQGEMGTVMFMPRHCDQFSPRKPKPWICNGDFLKYNSWSFLRMNRPAFYCSHTLLGSQWGLVWQTPGKERSWTDLDTLKHNWKEPERHRAVRTLLSCCCFF